ncbi:MAG: Ig-like domain-containing protein, partial [Methylocystaceae bacterium]
MVGNEENYSSAVEENSDMSSRKMNIPHPRLAAMGIAIIIIALITIGIYQLLPVSNASAGKVSISATKSGSNGVNTASWFKINLEKPIDQKAVTNSLKIFPAFSYTLKKKDGGREYQIIPRHQLAANTIYKFSFDQTGKGQENLSWAFQTTGEFCLISTLPHNETVGVPVNTGIEFIFSHDNFDLDQARKMVEISPRTEGRFEKHKRTLVFIPKALKPATLYTVTLKKGWGAINSRKSISKDEIFRFETASKTVSEQEFIFYLNNRMAEFTTRQIPTFPISFGTGASVPRPQVDVFRYTDAESYGAALENLQAIPYWCTNSESQFLEDTKGLTRVVGFKTSFNPASRYQYFIAMPDKIPAGYYLLNIKAGNQVRQAVFQVSDLAVYRAQSQKQTLLWVNDVMTKLPVTGIEVWSGDKKLVSGDDSGVVLINHDLSSPTAGYVVVKAGTRELLVPLEQETSFNNQGFLVSQGYWKYLYLDRELYLPGDTVHFFGVLSPRQGSTVPKGDLTLELWGGDYYYSEERTAEPLYTQKLNLQGNTFSGKYQLPVLKPGYYYLEVKLGKASLTSRGFTVATYQKPAYQVTVTPDKKAILVGEKINYRVKSTFFEGTAVPGLSLNYYLNNREGKVVTNIQGEANISYTGQYADDNYAPYNYEYFNVNASTPESGDISDYNGIIVFPGSVTVRADAVTKSDKFELTARLNRIDLSQMETGGYVGEDNYIKSPVSHGKIQARLYKEAWTRTQSGETYDYINKQVLPIYDYSY